MTVLDKSAIKKAYDHDSKRRDQVTQEDWKLKLRNKFAEKLKSEDLTSILELGSGVGLDAQYFKEQGFDVLATDISTGMVEKSKQKGLNAMVLDLYDVSQLKQTFDAVYSLNVLLHVPPKDLNLILTNLKKVITEGGIFMYGVYGGYDQQTVFADKDKDIPGRYFSLLSDNSLLNYATKHFEVIELERIYDINSKIKEMYFQGLWLRA